VTALALCSLSLIGAVGTGPAEPAQAVTTHTWTGADPDDPHNWNKAQNWDTSAVPANGDIVVINGARVWNVPGGKTFSKVTIKNSAFLSSGGPLRTAWLEAGCAGVDVDVEIVPGSPVPSVIAGLDVQEGKTFTNDGAVEVTSPSPLSDLCTQDSAGVRGRLRLNPGARFRNYGTLRGSGTVAGRVCCSNPQVLRNETTGIIDGSEDLTLANLRLHHFGRVLNGTVTLSGGSHVLTSSSRFANVVVFADDAAQVHAGPPGSVTTTKITLGTNAWFGLFGNAALYGFGEWTGPGNLALRKGFVYGGQTISADTTFSVSGPDGKAISRLGPDDPGEVAVFGKAVLWSGPLTIGGRLKIESGGRLSVPRGAAPEVLGATCCTAPVNGIRNRIGGRIDVGAGAQATFRSLQFDHFGTITGAGTLTLDRGIHVFANNSRVAGTVTVKSGTLRLNGTTTVTGVVRHAGGEVRTPTDGATVAGGGQWIFAGGTVTGRPTFGSSLRFSTVGPDLKALEPDTTRLRVEGPATLSGSGPLRLRAGAEATFAGRTTLAAATVDAWSCCTTPARVEFLGPVALRASAGPSVLEWVRAVFVDVVDLNGGVLEVRSALQPQFAAGAVLRLEGGTLRATSATPLWFGPGASLLGPGTLDADARVAGPLRFTARGDLAVQGSLELRWSAATTLVFGTAPRDRIVVRDGATLDGRLTLVNARSAPVGARLLQAATRTGTFGAVAGLPAGRNLFYGAGFVSLR
jgi:hypothetical protein